MIIAAVSYQHCHRYYNHSSRRQYPTYPVSNHTISDLGYLKILKKKKWIIVFQRCHPSFWGGGAAKKAHRGEGGWTVLLGEYTCDGAFMVRPIMLQCLGVWISTRLAPDLLGRNCYVERRVSMPLFYCSQLFPFRIILWNKMLLSLSLNLRDKSLQIALLFVLNITLWRCTGSTGKTPGVVDISS